MLSDRAQYMLSSLSNYLGFDSDPRRYVLREWGRLEERRIDPRQIEAERAVTWLLNRYEYLGYGLYRIAFRVGNHVLKFPRSEAGEYCNDMEGSIIDPNCARGRWIMWRGFICVMQEYIRIEDFDVTMAELKLTDWPDWTDGIDGCQVGLDRHGKLKAYDFVHP